MGKRKLIFLLTCSIVMIVFLTCEEGQDTILPGNNQVENGGAIEDQGIVNSEDFAYTVADIIAENSRDHDDSGDYTWNSPEVIQIVLDGNSVIVDGVGATANGSKVTITSAGTYSISGSLHDGQIIVNTEDKEIVRLILNGVDISNSTGATFNIINAEKTVIILTENTENYIQDGSSYIFENPEEDEPNAAIFSKDDLTIFGKGSLTVEGNYNDGITSKDGLIIASGTITVNSLDDGIRGKDYLIIRDGDITVNAGGDGLKSDNDEDTTKGYILIEGGKINIISGGDAIVAETDVLITNGEFTLATGGGSNSNIDESASAKGVKAGVNTIIDDGTITVNSADDAIHSNYRLVINGGNYVISSGDDAVHADSTLGVNGGDINITECYEGIESAVIVINYADIHIFSSDDGLNVATGNQGPGMFGGPGPRPGDFQSSGNYYLYINGGHILIDANGDGVDVNGSIVMTDGSVIINGPTSNMNSALDYQAWFKITGGFLLAAGSSGMAQAPGTLSTQNSLLINFRSALQAGTLFHIQSSEGKELFTFAPTKKYQSIVFSSQELTNGPTYDAYYGGSSTGTVNDGLYQDGSYTPGTKYTSFTVSGIVTRISNR